jgi:hypothetical protein
MEFDLGQFGDSRLQKGGAFLLDRIIEVGESGVRVRPLGGNRAGEVRLGRFLHNHRVTPAEMIATAAARTARLVEGRHILVIQDTTTLRDDGDQNSLNLHVAIAVDALDGALLGLVHAEFLRRTGGKKHDCGKRPFAAKESYRWLAAANEASKLEAAGAACVTVVADRECDIYDAFALRPAGTELVIRAHHDRVLAGGKRLFRCTKDQPVLGCQTISLPAAPGRPARDATLVLRACQVTLKRPMRNRAADAAKLPPKLTLTLVEACEINVPHGATPAHWRLLTTHTVTTLTDARRITGFYRERWTIEQLFRTKKTKGFDIEASRVADQGPFENLATATLIAAIQVLQLVRDRDGAAHRPMQDVFDPADQLAMEAVCASLEGNTPRQKNSHAKGSLAYASWVCARLGGWTGYYGQPGPVVMLQGLMRFKAMHHGWKLGRLI